MKPLRGKVPLSGLGKASFRDTGVLEGHDHQLRKLCVMHYSWASHSKTGLPEPLVLFEIV